MPRPPFRLAAVLALPLLAPACAPAGPAGGMAATTPVPPTAQQAAQQATPAAMPSTTAGSGDPACLASPDFARRPTSTHSGWTAEWTARANGRGCYWARKRV